MASFKKYGRGKGQRGFNNRFGRNKSHGHDDTAGFDNEGSSQGYNSGRSHSGRDHFSGGRGRSEHSQPDHFSRVQEQGVQLNSSRHPPHLRGRAIGMFYAQRGSGGSQPNSADQNRSNVQIDNERTSHLNSLLHAIESTRAAEFRNQGASFETSANTFSQVYNEYLDENRLRNEVFHEVFLPDKQSLPRNPNLDGKLRKQFEETKKSSQYQKMLHFRKKLPSFKMQNQILKLVEENQVVVLSGETGCGKTTQVSQFILDSYLETGRGSVCRIICTQPRRISAISVAERVAEERAERCGNNSSVGWHIRLEKKEARLEGSMIYCTTGILLQWLKNDSFLGTFSHIILDEIHERDLDTDFLMIILKDLLPRRPDLKLILMSATLNATMFSNYFGGCPMITIPGYTFPVKEYLLEDVLELIGFAPKKDDSYTPQWKLKRRQKRTDMMIIEDKEPFFRSLQGRYSPRTISVLRNWDENDTDVELIVALLHHICSKEKEGAVLVFLTGWDQIRDVSKLLEENKFFSRGCLILPLHSLMPTVNQREIFDSPPRGVRKIILSTNIAETSITIDDIVFVIDCGKMKMKNFDVENNVETLEPEFISLANAKQRRGRAGRVAAGICYHLYTEFRQMTFDKYIIPEMLRTRLETLCLKIKILKLGKIKPFLEKAMNPPDPKSVDMSIDLLKKLNALNEEECLTPLGFHLARLPMDPLIGRMILFGAIFSCLDPILTVAASLSFKDAFVTPFGMEKIVDQRKLEIAGDLKSDHLMLAKAFFQWEQACENGTDREYCWEKFLSAQTLKMLQKLKFQFACNLKDLKFLPNSNSKNPDFNIYSGTRDVINLKGECNLTTSNEMVLKAVLCAGLYPNVARVTKRVVGTKNNSSNLYILDTKVSFHPKSVNAKTKVFPSEWVVYYQKMKSSKIYLYDTTMVYPYGLLFFGGKISSLSKKGKGTATVDDWIVFNCPAETASIVKKLRNELDKLLEYKIEHPEDNSWITNENSKEAIVVRSIIDLIVSEYDPNLGEQLKNEKYGKKKLKKAIKDQKSKS